MYRGPVLENAFYFILGVSLIVEPVSPWVKSIVTGSSELQIIRLLVLFQ